MTAATSLLAFGPAKIGGDEAVRRVGRESQTSFRHVQSMTEGQSQMLETSSKELENRSKRMREHMQDAGGALTRGETRERWLERVATACGLSYRKAKSVWYREPVRLARDDLDRAAHAADQAQRDEIRDLRQRLAQLEKRIADEPSALAAGAA